MGIKHRDNSGRGLAFLNIDSKAGQFRMGQDKLEHGTSVEGILKKFSIKPDSFEKAGQVMHSEVLQLRIADIDASQPDVMVCTRMASGGDGGDQGGDAAYTALRMLAKLNAADLSKPIEIKPWFAEAGKKFGDSIAVKDMSGVAVKQGGQSLVDDYGNGVTKLPELQTIMAGGKPVIVAGKELKDKGPWNEVLDSLLNQIQAKLPAMAEQQAPADEGIDAGEAAAAAQQAAAQPAARPAMRARA